MDFSVDKLRKRIDSVRALLVYDEPRRELILKWFNILLFIVAGFMTVVNVFTSKWLLFCSTFVFTLACLFNWWLLSRDGTRKTVCFALFLTEALLLCGFFCISGTPEGFSALWTCFIPSFSFTLLGLKRGGIYSGLGFGMVALIFWTPFGRSLLQYEYTASFMLRFPMIYLAFLLMATCLEFVRAETQRQLWEAERRYHRLYRRDALTGILNRYGFNERFDQFFAAPDVKTLSLLILDLDFFKKVNDVYGHNAGDDVLRFVAQTLQSLSGEGAAVCRWGGEEFTSLIPNAADPAAIAERIRRQIEATAIQAGSGEIHITVTIGVCTVTDRQSVTIADMVRTADRNLYRAKDAGRNRVDATWL